MLLPLNNLRFFPRSLSLVIVCLGFVLSATVASAQVSGTVFRDFNGNGTKDNTTTFNESGAPNIIVTAYNTAGTAIASFKTGATGTYAIPATGTAYTAVLGSNTGFVASGTAVRLEFTNLATGEYSSAAGGTSVQFVTAPVTTADFAVLAPDDYWNNVTQPAPTLMIPHYQGGTISSSNKHEPAIVKFDNNQSGLIAGITKTTVAKYLTVGSVWGNAYQRKNDRSFFSAFLKRHAGVGPKGLGGVYIVEKVGAVDSVNAGFTLQGVVPSNSAVALDFGAVTRTTVLSGGASAATNDNYISSSTTDKNEPARDMDAFGKVGKVGYGSIDVDDATNKLYMVNLAQRRIVVLNVAGLTSSLNNATAAVLGPLTQTFDITALAGLPAAVNGDIRPFAIKIYKGKGYLGVTASGNNGSATRLIDNVQCYVLQFDPANIAAGFTNVLTMTMKYPNSPRWNPWADNWAQTGLPNTFAVGNTALYYQPLLSDISFDESGSMTLAVMDRFGHQMGFENYLPISGNVSTDSGGGFGDMLKACFNPSTSTWSMETSPTGCVSPSGNLDPSWFGYSGNGQPEFYYDTAGDGGGENNQGGLAKLMGTDRVVNVVVGPHPVPFTSGATYWNSSGVHWNVNSTGLTPQYAQLFSTSGTLYGFGKADGMGDIEFAQAPPPVEIGNRVWNDIDSDGVQDANETGIANVTLELFADANNDGVADGAALGTTTTSATGTWVFNATNVADGDPVTAGAQIGIQPGLRYLVRIAAADWATGIGVADLYGKALTLSNVGGAGQPDVRDNDATLVNATPQISALAGILGQNDHTFDFGFKAVPCCANMTPTGGFEQFPASFTFPVPFNTKPSQKIATGGTVANGWIAATTINPVWLIKDIPNTINNPQGDYFAYVKGQYDCLQFVDFLSSCESPVLNGSYNLTFAIAAWNQTMTGSGATLAPSVPGTQAASSYTVDVDFTDGSVQQHLGPFPIPASTSFTTLNWQTVSHILNFPGKTIASIYISQETTNGFAIDGVTMANVTYPNAGVDVVRTCVATPTTQAVSATPSTGFWTQVATNPSGATFGSTTAAATTISGLNAGVYNFIWNANGCSDTMKVTLTTPPTVVITGTLLTCNGSTTTITASGGASYLWSNAATTAAITVPAGNYTVTATNAAGCTRSTSVLVEGEIVTPAIAGAAFTCNGATTTITASGGVSYLWSNGATTAAITVAPGTYTVTATGAKGCTATATKVITNTIVTAAIAGNNFTCNGGNTTLTASGTGATSYLWSNAAITAAITVAAGTYTVTVTGTNGCTSTASKVITNTVITPGLEGNLFVCNGGTTALIATGGATYSWSDGRTTDANTVGAGTYTVTVTGLNNCTASTVIVVTNTIVTAAIAGNASTCNGGTALLTASGGTSYLWSNTPAATTAAISVPAGTYTVTITGTNNCTATASKVLTNTVVTAAIAGNASTCNGGTTTLTASGTGATAYIWSNTPAATTAAISVPAGTYTVTITGTNNCTATASKTLTNTVVTAAIAGNNFTCNGGTTTLTASGTGATAYIWSNAAASTTAAISVPAGTYTVTVTGTNGCTSTASLVVANTVVSAAIAGNASTCNGGTTTLTASGTGATSYIWSNTPAATTAAITVPAGTYTVTITGTSTCTATATKTLTNTVVTAAIAGNNFTCNGGTTTLTASGTGATAYIWSNAAASTTAAITVPAGTYTVTVTGTNGCTATASLVVTNTVLTPAITGGGTICTGTTATLAVTGGTSYIWSANAGSATTASVTVGGSGTYTVTVNNGSGCTATATTVLTVYNVGALASGGEACKGGTINLTITGASLASFAWTGPAGFTSTLQNPVLTNVTAANAGVYNVTITASNGCSVTTYANALVFAVNAGADQTICDATTATIAIPTATQTWTPLATNPSTSSVSAAGVVTGLTATGVYNYELAQTFNPCAAPTNIHYPKFTLVESPLFERLDMSSELRIGGAASYEMDLHRISPFTVFAPQRDFVWANGVTQPFSVTYNPAAVGTNKFVFTYGSGAGLQTLGMDPAAPPSGAAFDMTTLNSIWLYNKVSVGTAGSVKVNNLVLNGSAVADSCLVNNTIEEDNLLMRGYNLSGGFTLTGNVKMSWTGAQPSNSAMSLGIKMGKAFCAPIVCRDTVQIIRSAAPVVTGTTTSPTCTGGTANTDGKITLSGFGASDRFQYSTGATFNSASAIPSSITTIPASGIIASTLPNPSGATQVYTVRVYSASNNNCYTDVVVTLNRTTCAVTIGNYVWTDLNKNGTNDEPTSAGLNGVTVQLLKETTPGSGVYTVVNTTTTANDGAGNPGYYGFTATETANYKVRFPTSIGSTILTTQTTTAATDNNSDANATTGDSPAFAMDVNGTGFAKNNLTIDAGYQNVGNIGNFVWTDTNGNGLQDDGTTAGINGVVVELYKETAPGSGVYTLSQTTTTANNTSGSAGYYNFVVTETANYYVKFPAANGANLLTTQTATAATDGNSDAYPSGANIGKTPVFAIDVNGTGTARNNTTLDAGYQPIATVGNLVWLDANGNGLQDDPFVATMNGATVELYKETAPGSGVYTLSQTTTTTNSPTTSNPGYYNFVLTETANYYVKFPTAIGTTKLTQQVTTAATDGNSDAYTTGANIGRTPIFAMDINGTGTAKNNTTLDAGFQPFATVGNYAWHDLDKNGLNNEPASAGINGLVVELWNSVTNTLVSSTTTANDGSGNPGYYSFDVLASGSYYVKFPTSANGRTLTTQTTTANTDNNSDANVTTGRSPVFTLDINGTGFAKNNLTIDAGYICLPDCGTVIFNKN
jgi:trimeric autotransporter adhesin